MRYDGMKLAWQEGLTEALLFNSSTVWASALFLFAWGFGVVLIVSIGIPNILVRQEVVSPLS